MNYSLGVPNVTLESSTTLFCSPRNGGHYCKGKKRRYLTCNHHECAEGEGDIRQRYCEENPPSNRHSVWKPVSLGKREGGSGGGVDLHSRNSNANEV